MANSDQSPASSRGVAPTPPAPAPQQALKPAGSPATPVQQSLVFPRASRSGQTPRGHSRPRKLWFGIHFPVLPLDALHLESGESGKEKAGPVNAVFEERHGMRRILLANPAAQNEGVTAGLSVNAALALVPGLVLLARDTDRERQLLEELATWAERFTSLVSIEPPDVLLLEIAGSLGLFGGMDALRQQIEAGLAGRRVTVSLAIAPTPLASVWLARSATGAAITDMQYLAGALGALPLQCLQWPVSVCESLRGMGITAVRDCLRLPRQGFVRRFGTARLMQLDRALGRLPDPRRGFRAPERFCHELELPEEQDDRALLLAACRRLLEELEAFLVTRQVAVQHLHFSFFHLKGAATHLPLGALRQDHRIGCWFELLEIKLDRLTLPEPVIAIRLRGGRTRPLQAASETLPFGRAAGRKQIMPVTHLMERLVARIGDDCVHGVTAVAEHRPQYAWSTVRTIGSRIPQCALPQNPWQEHESQPFPDMADLRRTGSLLLRRPLWMLAEPLSLSIEQDLPQYHGPLRIESGPERLETGWWDGNGIARDYFVAVNPKGIRFWIYRTRDRQGGWYLHGIFA